MSLGYGVGLFVAISTMGERHVNQEARKSQDRSDGGHGEEVEAEELRALLSRE